MEQKKRNRKHNRMRTYFIQLLLSCSSVCPFWSAFMESTVVSIQRSFRLLYSHNFSSYIFIIVASSSYVTRPSNVSSASFEYLSYISFASVIRSKRTIERQYRNARQRVINNSASELTVTPSTTSETFPAITNHRRTTRIAPSCNRKFFRDSPLWASKSSERHASFNSIVGFAPIYIIIKSCFFHRFLSFYKFINNSK